MEQPMPPNPRPCLPCSSTFLPSLPPSISFSTSLSLFPTVTPLFLPLPPFLFGVALSNPETGDQASPLASSLRTRSQPLLTVPGLTSQGFSWGQTSFLSPDPGPCPGCQLKAWGAVAAAVWPGVRRESGRPVALPSWMRPALPLLEASSPFLSPDSVSPPFLIHSSFTGGFLPLAYVALP